MLKTHKNFSRLSRRSGHIVMSAVVLAFTGTAAPTMAQDTSNETVLEEIVVTATRREATVQSTPISITAITGDNIEAMGIVNSRGLEAITPGLHVQGGFANTSPQWNIRGVGSNGFVANDVGGVGIYLDDVYLNSNVGQGFHLFDTERVEVLRGPQGTLFGANTTGGAIQFVSRRPSTDGFTANTRLTVGKFDLVKFEGGINIPINDRLAVRAAFLSEENDGIGFNAALQENAIFTDLAAWRISAALQATDNLHVMLRAWHGQSTGSELTTFNQGTFDPVTGALCSSADIAAFRCVDSFGYNERATHGESHTLEADQRDTGNVRSDGVSLTLTWDIGNAEFTSITAFHSSERFMTDNIDASRQALFTEEYENEDDQLSQEFRLASTDDGPFNWLVGAFYLEEEAYDAYIFNFPPAGIWREYDLELTSSSVFGEVSYEFNDSWKVFAGLRTSKEEKDAIDYYSASYDIPNYLPNVLTTEAERRANVTSVGVPETNIGDDWSSESGRVILQYRPSENFQAYGSYSRGFRGGNFTPLAFSLADLVLVEPEFVDSIELGAKMTFWNDRARLNVSVFNNDYTDLQVVTIQTGLNFGLTNAGEATTSGAEVELTIQPTNQFMAHFGLSFLDAEYDKFDDPRGDFSGNELENSPGTTLTGLLQYDIPFGGDYSVTLQSDFSFKDEHFQDFTNNPASIQEEYWLVNASINFGPTDRRYGIQAWVKNLTDEYYRVNWFDVSSSGFNGLNIGNPLTAGITFSLNLD